MMPSGIPVATVAIDGAKNAALLAIEILALSDESLADKLDQARIAGAEAVLEKDRIVDSKYSHYVTQ
jgi:5-(carboxyamino)imidazole ribonucleotide mutase